MTGSLANTQLVSDYYSQHFGDYLTIHDKTEMHVKMHGSVGHLSQVFNTTFKEYSCPYDGLCFATNSDVSIPSSLQSASIGVLGAEQILQPKPNYVIRKKSKTLKDFKDNYILILSRSSGSSSLRFSSE